MRVRTEEEKREEDLLRRQRICEPFLREDGNDDN
jgi:hypothetical protein